MYGLYGGLKSLQAENVKSLEHFFFHSGNFIKVLQILFGGLKKVDSDERFIIC